jgi:hypothetical protein
LLVATVLGVYKPLGMTAYGARRQDALRLRFQPTPQKETQVRGGPLTDQPYLKVSSATRDGSARGSTAITPGWLYVSWLVAIGVLLLFAALHLIGRIGGH